MLPSDLAAPKSEFLSLITPNSSRKREVSHTSSGNSPVVRISFTDFANPKCGWVGIELPPDMVADRGGLPGELDRLLSLTWES